MKELRGNNDTCRSGMQVPIGVGHDVDCSTIRGFNDGKISWGFKDKKVLEEPFIVI